MAEKLSLIPGDRQENPKKTVSRERIEDVLSSADRFRAQRRLDRHRLRFMRRRLGNTLS